MLMIEVYRTSYILHYHHSYGFGMFLVYEVVQDFYHQPCVLLGSCHPSGGRESSSSGSRRPAAVAFGMKEVLHDFTWLSSGWLLGVWLFCGFL